ncbi:MAG: hypothetical protein U0Y08_14430 [Bacteroidia bacterium]
MADTHALALLQIQEHLAQGRTGAALSELQLLLGRQADHGRAQALYGRILFRYLNDFTAAEEAFRTAMRNAPADPELYVDYGELLLRLDKATETVAILNRALEVPGVEKDKIFRIFSQLYERQSKWDDALEYNAKALMFTLNDEMTQQCLQDQERIRRKMGQQ